MSGGDILQGWHWGDVLLAAAALRTGLLEAVGEHGDPDLAASALGLEARAARIVCGPLADAGLLADGEGRWSVNDRGRHLLTPADGGPDLAGELLETERSIAAHTRLADVLAGPVEIEDVSTGDADTRRRFLEAMRRRGGPLAPRVAAAAGPPTGAGRLPDVGGAPGTTAGAFTELGWEVTVLDLPETVDLVRADLAEAGVAAVVGDMTQALPDGGWDCVHLGDVVHLLHPDDAAALVARAGAALARAGCSRPGSSCSAGARWRGGSGC